MLQGLRLQRLPSVQSGVALAMRALAIAIVAAAASVALLAVGEDPLALGAQLISATFSSTFGMEDFGLLVTPLILTGLSVAIGQQIGTWNIGAEGQFLAGAFAATAIGLFVPGPAVLILPLMIAAGAFGGLVWILVPTLARAFAGVNELITTLLLNFVAALLVYYVSTGPWRDRVGMSNSSTARIAVEVPEFWGLVHWGLPIAILMALAAAAMLAFSRWGYEVRLSGSNPSAAAYAGIAVRRHLVTVMLLSGTIAGIAGAFELAGTVHRLQGGISNNFGYLGIMVAVLARNSCVGIIFTGTLMAFILNSGIILQTQGITTSAVLAMTGAILFLTAIGDELAHYRIAGAGSARP